MERISPFIINQPLNSNLTSIQNTTKVTPAQAQEKFSTALKDAISNLNDTQVQSDVATEKFIKGEMIDLHQVMIAAEKASVTRTAAIEVRNKVIEAYKEIMRMQV